MKMTRAMWAVAALTGALATGAWADEATIQGGPAQVASGAAVVPTGAQISVRIGDGAMHLGRGGYGQGHWETRTVRVLVAPGRYEYYTTPGHYEYRRYGHTEVRTWVPGRTERVYVPPRYEYRTERYWVPGPTHGREYRWDWGRRDDHRDWRRGRDDHRDRDWDRRDRDDHRDRRGRDDRDHDRGRDRYDRDRDGKWNRGHDLKIQPEKQNSDMEAKRH